MSHHEIDPNTSTELNATLTPHVSALQDSASEHSDWKSFETQILEQMDTSEWNNEPSESWLSRFNIGDWFTFRRLGFASTAMSSLLVVILVMTGTSQSSFANVLEQIKQMHSLVMTSTIQVATDVQTEVVVYYKEPDQMRTVVKTIMNDRDISSVITITNLSLAQSTVLLPNGNRAMSIQLPQDSNRVSPEYHPLFWLDELKATSTNDYLELGESEIDGRPTIGYKVTGDVTETIIWADIDTGIPLRFEVHAIAGGLSSLTDFEVIGDVQFNPTLGTELFDLSIPDDYQVSHIDASHEGNSAVNGIKSNDG